MKKEYLSQAWLVLILALLMGGALAGVELGLRKRIQENKMRETLSQVPLIVPGSQEARLDEELGRRYGNTVIRAMDAGGKQVGWVIEAVGPGYAGDPITMLVGLDPTTQVITGLYVLEQKETPNLGSLIVEESFRQRFEGKCGNGCLEVTKSDKPNRDEIQAITGATLSSEAVVKAVNKATSAFRSALFGDAEVRPGADGTSVPDAGEGRSYGN